MRKPRRWYLGNDAGERWVADPILRTTFWLVLISPPIGIICGIVLIIRSPRYSNPTLIRKYGRFVFVLSVVGLILTMLGVYIGVWTKRLKTIHMSRMIMFLERIDSVDTVFNVKGKKRTACHNLGQKAAGSSKPPITMWISFCIATTIAISASRLCQHAWHSSTALHSAQNARCAQDTCDQDGQKQNFVISYR